MFGCAGETREELEASPFAEQLLDKGYEVIYFTDPVDEYVMQNLLEYEDFKFQSASKEDLKLGDKDAKKENKKLRVSHVCVIPWHTCNFLVLCAHHALYCHRLLQTISQLRQIIKGHMRTIHAMLMLGEEETAKCHSSYQSLLKLHKINSAKCVPKG